MLQDPKLVAELEDVVLSRDSEEGSLEAAEGMAVRPNGGILALRATFRLGPP